jgi:hypothetical protein
MKLLLNVGLKRNDNAADNTMLRTIAALNRAGFLLHRGEVSDSTHPEHGTERVLVCCVEYIRPLSEPSFVAGLHSTVMQVHLNYAAAQLAQDCIAVASIDTWGRVDGLLIGPNSSKWGDFDPQYFIHPSALTLKDAA